MNKTVEILKASKHYSDLLDCFSTVEKLSVNLNSREISRAIYFHIFKMKYAGWRNRIKFKRKKKHTMSDFFQDIVAFYLKASLSEEYEIELEAKRGKLQVDIAIMKNGNYHFLIEVKTSIGWERPNMKQEKPFAKITKRVEELASNFNVPEENIIYIFETHGNVSKVFSEFFWDKKNHVPVKRSTENPYSIIYPLFNDTDPYYSKYHDKNEIDKTKEYIHISDKDIWNKSEKNIVTPFENILEIIKSRK